MLPQRLATGATGEIQARAYEAARHSYVHAQYIHSLPIVCVVAIEGPWHLLFNVRQCMVKMPAYKFRRGFCTLVLSFEYVNTVWE